MYLAVHHRFGSGRSVRANVLDLSISSEMPHTCLCLIIIIVIIIIIIIIIMVTTHVLLLMLWWGAHLRTLDPGCSVTMLSDQTRITSGGSCDVWVLLMFSEA